MMGMRRRRARIAHRATASLLAILLAAVLVTGCGDTGEKRDAVEARMGQLLAEQSQLRQFLEVDFFGIGEDVSIAAPPPSRLFSSTKMSTSIVRNGKLDIPPGVSDRVRAALTEYEPQIVAVFKEFGCRSIA